LAKKYGSPRSFLQCTISALTADLALEETVTGAMAAFAIAVGSTLLVCDVLMTRLQNRGAQRGHTRAAAIAVGAAVAPNAAKKRLRFDLAQRSFLD
jgi:hypothetical protein